MPTFRDDTLRLVVGLFHDILYMSQLDDSVLIQCRHTSFFIEQMTYYSLKINSL